MWYSTRTVHANFLESTLILYVYFRLAENRSRNLSVPTFSTDLDQEDLDESVTDYMNAEKCFEAFSRQRSMEDLLNI